MRSSRRARLGLVLLTCLAAGVAGWLAYHPPGKAPAVEGAPEPQSVAGSGAIGPTAAESPAAAEPPPSLEVLPLAVRDLAAEAHAGDARAACRLGLLLARCRSAGALNLRDEDIERMRRQEAAFEAKGNLKAANQSAQWLLMAENHRRYCRDLPSSYLGRAPKYLRQAAIAGEPQAMVRYLRGDAFAMIGAVGGHDFSSPDFRLWRREAIGMLQALLREGRPEAALLLLEAHSNLGTNLSLITPPDPTLDEAYLRLARRLFSDLQLPDGWRESPLGVQASGHAETLARQWHQEYFKGRRLSIGQNVLDYPNPFSPTDAEPWQDSSDWGSGCDARPGTMP